MKIVKHEFYSRQTNWTFLFLCLPRFHITSGLRVIKLNVSPTGDRLSDGRLLPSFGRQTDESPLTVFSESF